MWTIRTEASALRPNALTGRADYAIETARRLSGRRWPACEDRQDALQELFSTLMGKPYGSLDQQTAEEGRFHLTGTKEKMRVWLE